MDGKLGETVPFIRIVVETSCSLDDIVSTQMDRLVGLVVKVSTSRTEDSRFASRLRQDFFWVKSYQ